MEIDNNYMYEQVACSCQALFPLLNAKFGRKEGMPGNYCLHMHVVIVIYAI